MGASTPRVVHIRSSTGRLGQICNLEVRGPRRGISHDFYLKSPISVSYHGSSLSPPRYTSFLFFFFVFQVFKTVQSEKQK